MTFPYIKRSLCPCPATSCAALSGATCQLHVKMTLDGQGFLGIRLETASFIDITKCRETNEHGGKYLNFNDGRSIIATREAKHDTRIMQNSKPNQKNS